MASKQKTTEAKAPVLKGQEGALPTRAYTYMRLTSAPPLSGGQGPRVHQDGEPRIRNEQLWLRRGSDPWQMNRPFGAVDVSANLKGAVPKTATQKILVALAEKGEVVQKTYGELFDTLMCLSGLYEWFLR